MQYILCIVNYLLCIYSRQTDPSLSLCVLPSLSLAATELLLEPSGGRAILVDSALVAKRSPAPPAAEVRHVSDVSWFS